MNCIVTLWKQYTTRAIICIIVLFSLSTSLSAQQKVFASTVEFENNVDNANQAINDMDDFATLNSRGGIIGIGGFTGELEVGFAQPIPANTTSFVKINFQEDILNALLGGSLGDLLANLVSGLVLGNHYFVIEARDVNGNTVLSNNSINPPNDGRFRVVVDDVGDFYIAITPNATYDKIYIQDRTDALLIGLDNSMDVKNVFYLEETPCATDPLFTDFDGTGITLDVLDIGEGGVTNPEFAIDDDPDNFSEISMGILGVAGSMRQNIYFPNVYTPEDAFEIELKIDPSVLAEVDLFSNIQIKAYNGVTEVYDVILSDFIELDILTLLESGQRGTVTFNPGVSFDRVSVSIGAVVGVNLSQSLDLYGVTISATEPPTTNNDTQFFCAVSEPTVADIAVNEPNVIWYENEFGGTPLAPSAPLSNNETYYGARLEDGCESELRLAVTIEIGDTPTPTTDTTDQSFCAVDDPTVADIDVNETDITWYDAPTGGTAFDPSDDLMDDTTYYAAATGSNNCESSVRLAVDVNIEDTPTPTTDTTDQSFCAVDDPTVADIDVNETDITWYDAPTGGTAFDPSDDLMDDTTYYAAATGSNNCESSVRLAVDVNIEDTPTPTTDTTDQSFCAVDDPTVADIDVNETDITWYYAPTGGTAFDPSDDLMDDTTYYAAATGSNNCESSVRLAVDVNIEDTPTPTTDTTDQSFCAVDDPTVADIDVNETDITWYDAPTGGTAFDPSDDLMDDTTYYAAATGSNNCESSVRLAVDVNIEDTPTPTTDTTDQSFCAVDDPTVADIAVNETDITWYDEPTGGTAFDPSDDLMDDTTYYAAATGSNNCESSVRLAVDVNIEDTPTPTTDTTDQSFCAVDDPTVADIDVNETDITWYDAPTGGTAYDPTDLLIDGRIYYASQLVNGCESSVRLAVAISVEDTAIPTTNTTNQSFCVVDAATIADLQVNEPNITWYDTPTGGTAFGPNDLLVDGVTYYAAAIGPTGCESSNRLAVTVAINDTATPTTDNQAQSFCIIDEPTVADIMVNEPNIVWYDSPSNGTAYDPTEPLMDGTTYYAAATGSNGCESSERLAVTINLNNTDTPTTTNTNQSFCQSTNPTIADIVVDGPNIIWYDAPEGGNAYEATDLLVDGETYYASATGDSNCESSERLAVTITLDAPADPTLTSDGATKICLNTAIRYETDPGNSNYVWEVVGGDIIEGGTSTENFAVVLWNTMDITSVSVSYDSNDSCSTGNTTTLNELVTVCADITISKTVDNPEPMIGDNVTFTIEVFNEGPNDFSDILVLEDMPSGFDLISFDTNIGTYNPLSGEWNIPELPAGETARLTIIAEVLDQGDYLNTVTIMTSNPFDVRPANNTAQMLVEPICLFVFNEFSPNNDGVNDFFTISCIENFPNNELKIFNRYGSLVFEARGYSNNWDGRANVSNVSNKGEVLPSETYYYVLEFDDSRKPKTGWLFLIK